MTRVPMDNVDFSQAEELLIDESSQQVPTRSSLQRYRRAAAGALAVSALLAVAAAAGGLSQSPYAAGAPVRPDAIQQDWGFGSAWNSMSNLGSSTVGTTTPSADSVQDPAIDPADHTNGLADQAKSHKNNLADHTNGLADQAKSHMNNLADHANRLADQAKSRASDLYSSAKSADCTSLGPCASGKCCTMSCCPNAGDSCCGALCCADGCDSTTGLVCKSTLSFLSPAPAPTPMVTEP